jgi:phosphatidylglycerol:prolipoprotein diacylglycerol transferase
MPRSKSRKTNRRGTTAAKTASSRARREGQQQAQAATAASQADARPGTADTTAAKQAPANTSPAGSGSAGTARSGQPPAKTSAAGSGSAGTARSGQPPAKTSAARRGNARTAAAGPAPENGAPPDATTAESLPRGLAPVRRQAKASAAPAPPAKTAAANTAATKTAATKTAAAPDETPDDMPAWAAKAAEKLLTVTYWLDPGEQGDPFSATIYFSGKRTEVSGKPRRGDTFSQEERVEGILPGSGPVAITAEVRGVNPGDWTVTARPVARPGGSPVRPYPPAGANGGSTLRAPWPRRVAIPATQTATARTAMLPFTKVPGVIRFAYAALVSLGVLVGLALETLLLTAHHYDAVRPIVLSVAAVAGGVVGAKAWYVGVQRGRKFDGWCIQGFVAGVAVVAGAAAFVGAGVPAGVYLSATAPALLLGIAIGRPGCFWAGCCTGRPTSSRWAIWSSDRRVGCRREPAQLLEAAAALVTGLGVLAVVLAVGLQRSGPVAVAGLAAYTLGRQLALGLRSEPRRFRHGRQVTAAAAAVVLIASLALLARG